MNRISNVFSILVAVVHTYFQIGGKSWKAWMDSLPISLRLSNFMLLPGRLQFVRLPRIYIALETDNKAGIRA